MLLPLNRVLVISGPTSAGKTSLGLEIAKELDAIIISADSRQIYKLMDVGTGKVPISNSFQVNKETDHWIVNGVPVFGYDLIKPDETFSAYDFCNYGRKIISTFAAQEKNVIVIGGTGFYIDTLSGRVMPSNIPPNEEFRAELNSLSLPELQDRLQKLSEKIYQEIDNKNKVRIIRAIEKITLPSQPLNLLELPANTTFVQIGLKTSNEKMFSGADTWADTVWHNGLLEETAHLLNLGYEHAPPLNGLIYKTAKDYIKGTLDESTSLSRVKFDLHAYIRRQLTWFKRNPDIHWFDISDMSKNQIKSAIMNIFSV